MDNGCKIRVDPTENSRGPVTLWISEMGNDWKVRVYLIVELGRTVALMISENKIILEWEDSKSHVEYKYNFSVDSWVEWFISERTPSRVALERSVSMLRAKIADLEEHIENQIVEVECNLGLSLEHRLRSSKELEERHPWVAKYKLALEKVQELLDKENCRDLKL